MDDLTLIARLIGEHINPGANLTKVIALANQANPDELKILADLMRIKAAQQYFGEVMRGAHVELVDGHAAYHTWRTLRTAKSRASSHQSDGTQYQVSGPFSKAILFGKRRDVTWLQLEGHPWSGVKSRLGHVADFFRYKVTGKNQGPYGSSRYVENYPLRIELPPKPNLVVVPRMIIR